MRILAIFIAAALCLHAQNVWPGGIGGGGGSSSAGGLANLNAPFTSATTVNIGGQGSPYVLVSCYDNQSPANQIFANSVTVQNTAPYNITVTFSSPQTGFCVVNSAGAATTASSFTTNGTNSGAVTLTAKTGGGMFTLSVPDGMVTGGTNQFFGPATSITGCSISASASFNGSGSYTSGTAGTCTVTIVFPVTAPNGWACNARDITTTTDIQNQTTASNTTQAVFAGTTASGDVVRFQCAQY